MLLPNEEALNQMLVEATTLSPRAAALEAIKVEVSNGTASDSWDALAAARLNYAGYQTNITAADRHDYSTTVIVDYTPTQDPNQQQALLASLGLPQASIIALPDANSAVKYHVILGYDYEPCFKPQDLSH